MIEHDEHPSKATAWREGRFVVHPDAQLEDCTVWVGADRDTDGAVKWEGLLARRLATGQARLCAVPFWVYDLSLGDEVEVMQSEEGALLVTGLARDAGNFTFRVRFDDATDHDERWRDLIVRLEPFECWADVRSPGFLALSAPPDQAPEVARYLQTCERDGELVFETGRTALPTE